MKKFLLTLLLIGAFLVTGCSSISFSNKKKEAPVLQPRTITFVDGAIPYTVQHDACATMDKILTIALKNVDQEDHQELRTVTHYVHDRTDQDGDRVITQTEAEYYLNRISDAYERRLRPRGPPPTY
tara:strand:+ start:68 stop:445 length:378 start_codon:yes stop_codon:yes gene_type:complete